MNQGKEGGTNSIQVLQSGKWMKLGQVAFQMDEDIRKSLKQIQKDRGAVLDYIELAMPGNTRLSLVDGIMTIWEANKLDKSKGTHRLDFKDYEAIYLGNVSIPVNSFAPSYEIIEGHTLVKSLSRQEYGRFKDYFNRNVSFTLYKEDVPFVNDDNWDDVLNPKTIKPDALLESSILELGSKVMMKYKLTEQ